MKGLSQFLWLLLLVGTAVNAQVLDIAHRGYATDNPESTMQAFLSAHRQGADGLEFDVRQTKDNVLVVAHDANIKALTNRAIKNTLFSDVYMATDMPSLEEVLVFAKASGQTVWIEVKQSHRYPGIIDRLLGLITKYGLEDKTVIQSFNHLDLQLINAKKPHLALLALYGNNFRVNTVAAYIDYVGLPIIDRYLDPQMIQTLQGAGKQVIFWRRDARSETKQVLEQFIKAGADGFMLDRSLKEIMQ